MTARKSKTKPATWYLYILLCDNGTLYTGITKDLQKRLEQHANGKGAKYTRNHGVKEIVYTENYSNRSEASIREAAVKRLSRLQKKKLIKGKLLVLQKTPR